MLIVSIQVGLPRTYHDIPSAYGGKGGAWTTAIFKEAIDGPVWATKTGLRGDGQADRRFHGGPDKALNVYCLAHYAFWTQELGLDAMPFGAFGENLTLSDGLEKDVCIGDKYKVGDTVVQVSQPRQPCGTLARRWQTADLVRRVEKSGMTGWYLRVLEEGDLLAKDVFELLERPHPKWTITAANEVMHQRKKDYAAARELAALPALAESWREALEQRAAGKG